MRNLLMLCVVCLAVGNGPATALSTYKDWDGSEFISTFGCPNTSTYGQIITIPTGKQTLDAFSFWWRNNGHRHGSMVVRGEVYAWDGAKATGSSLYESPPRTISYGDNLFHKESFAPAGLALTPGAAYVIFASIDKDYEECQKPTLLAWGFISESTYSGGLFVFQNNSGNSGQWTSSPWTVYEPHGVLAFTAHLSR